MKLSFVSKIAITVIIALLAPVFSYTIFQFSQRNQDEAMIKQIYDGQLSSLLYSVNNHCYDTFHSWSSELAALIGTNRQIETSEASLQQFISRNPSVLGLVVLASDTLQSVHWQQILPYQTQPIKQPDNFSRLRQLIHQSKDRIDRMVRQAQGGYIRHLHLTWAEGAKDGISVLVFPVLNRMNPDNTLLVNIFIHDLDFANNVIADKFRAMEQEEGHFVFAVIHRKTGQLLYTNIEEEGGSFERRDPLWILSNLDLSIKMSGATLDDISQNRVKQNLIFIILVNIILVFGIIYLLKNIMKEVSLAQMKTDFVANVSHELRTPLALIRMHAETLEMGRIKSREKKQQYYHTIMNESARLTQLINNILDFSRIESQKKKYRLEPADLSILMEETLIMYNYRLEQNGFVVDKKIEHDLPAIHMDKEAITLVLVNLLDNAIKFSRDRKEIAVRVQKEEKDLVLSVQDYGIGIPESEHKKIFEKFYRVGSSLVHDTKGSGLGLSLIKHIMDYHHGRIKVDSKLGKGSTFSLWFPINKKGA